MRGNRRFIWAWVAALVLLPGPVTGVAAAAAKPFVAPVETEVSRGFEAPSHRFGAGHRGIDYQVPPGTPVKASGAGTVSFAGPVAGGLYVTIQHAGGIATTYSYLSRIDVAKGDQVTQAQVIAASGDGHDGGPPGLHFGAKRNGEYIDPMLLLSNFDDISDLLQLQPTTDGSDAGNPAFRALTAGAFAGPEIGTGPDAVSDFPQIPPGLQPVLEPVNPAPVDRDGPNEEGSPPIGSPINPDIADGRASSGNGDMAAPAIPTRSPPKQVATWWTELTEEEKARLIANDSSRIGRLEGLPAAARDAANRISLQKEIENLQRERAAAIRALRELEGRYGSRYADYGGRQRSAAIKSAREKLGSLNRRLTNARHLRDSLARAESRAGDGLEPHEVFLLEFDTAFADDEGRAAVALGNPDTAEHVGVVVPGIDNRLSNFAGTLNRAANLRQSVFDLYEDAAPRTSTIAWLGYDTPESVFDAMDRGEARAGARRLKAFVENLRVTRQQFGGGGILTIFGHSYGSTTGALAARDGLVMDNLALVGSPGAAATHAKHLVGAKRVWAGRAWDDIIRLSTGFALLGDDPTNRNFGSIRIPTCCERIGHGRYFDPNTRSGQNLARILIGEYQDVS